MYGVRVVLNLYLVWVPTWDSASAALSRYHVSFLDFTQESIRYTAWQRLQRTGAISSSASLTISLQPIDRWTGCPIVVVQVPADLQGLLLGTFPSHFPTSSPSTYEWKSAISERPRPPSTPNISLLYHSMSLLRDSLLTSN